MSLFLFNLLFSFCIFSALVSGVALCGSDAPQKTEMCIVMFLFSLPSAPLRPVSLARRDGSRFPYQLGLAQECDSRSQTAIDCA